VQHERTTALGEGINNYVKNIMNSGATARNRKRVDDYLLYANQVHSKNAVSALADASEQVHPAVQEKRAQRQHRGKPGMTFYDKIADLASSHVKLSCCALCLLCFGTFRNHFPDNNNVCDVQNRCAASTPIRKFRGAAQQGP
jgi:hypothetical protein